MKKIFNLKSKTAIIKAKRLFVVCVTLCFLLGNVALSPLSVAMAKTTNTSAKEVRIKSIVNPSDYYVDNSTTVKQLKKLLPSKVNVVMENKLKSTATVTWNTENYVSEVKSTKSFTLTGKVKGTKLTAQIKVVVANPYITAIKTPASISVANGTKEDNLNLPKYVSVTKSNDSTANAKVVWDTSTYNGNVTKATTFEMKGNVKGTEKIATITVKVAKPFVISAIKPSVLVVDNGTTLQQLNAKLPTFVSVKLSNGKTSTEKVTWDTTGYNGNVEKETTYTFNGTLVKSSKITTTITVKVGETFIAEIIAPSTIYVENNTTLELVKAKLPQTVKVKMSNGIDSTAKVTWDSTGYNGNVTVAKVYEFTGTVEGTSKTTTISISVAAPYIAPVTPPQTPVDPWTLVWSDEFDKTGTNLDTNGVDLNKWGYQNGTGAQYGLDGWGNNEQQYYTSDNIEVISGNLVITPEIGTIEGKPYSSGRLWTSPTFTKTYGKFEARMKLPVGQGFWPAFWMMPKADIYGGWAASGELDIMEARGAEPTKVGGTLHYGGTWPSNKYTGKDYNFTGDNTINEFHTYSVEWEPGEIRWYVDGVLYQTQNNWSSLGSNGEEKYAFPAPFDQEYYIILNLAIGGNYVGNVVPGESDFASNPKMEVDYVRVYELEGRSYMTPVEPNVDTEPLPEGGRVPDATGNLVNDINFENGIIDNAEGIDANFGDGWNFIHNAQFAGQAIATIDAIDGKNFAKIDVTNIGNQPYSVQMEQHTTLTKGRWYQFSFDAKADGNRTLSAKLGGGPGAGWGAYSDAYTFNLNTEIQSFSKVFQMTKTSDILTRIEFNCATSVGPVWIGNVKVIEVAAPQIDYNMSKEPLPNSGNHIYNGAFDKYTIDRMSYWNFNVAAEAAATANVPEGTRELNVNIVNGGTSSNAIELVQKGMKLLTTDEYKVTMKARSLSDRTIEASLISKDGATNYSGVQTINLTSAMEEKTFTFTMPDITDLEGQFVLDFGGNDADVFIDDVVMVRLPGAEPVANITDTNIVTKEANVLLNGDFTEDTTSWTSWWGDQWSGYSTGEVTAENGKMKIHLASIGTASYAAQVFEEGFDLENGKTYVVSFKAKADVARKMNVNIGKALTADPWFTNYAATKVIDIGTTEQQYTYIFTVTEATYDNIKMVFEVGNIAGGAAVTDIYLDDIKIQEAVTAIVPTSLINTNTSNVVSNGDFTEDTANWTAWWGDQWSGYSTGDVTAENGKMKIHLASIGTASYAAQVYEEGLDLENGKTYVVSFKAKADIARKMNINIGKALTADPWFTNYAATKVIDIATTEQQYTYIFTVTEPTYDNIKMVFEVGNVAGGAAVTDIYLDDISIQTISGL